MYPRWLWAGFALPGVVWLLLLFLVPFYAVIGVAFGNVDALLQTPIPIWNPLDWNVGWMQQVLGDLAPGGVYWGAVVRTLEYVFLSLFFSVLIGYPVAYYIARHAGRTKNVLLILLIMPFWISYLMRMLAWVNLLAADGYATRFLDFTHAQQPGCQPGPFEPARRLVERRELHGDHGACVRLHPVLHPAAVRLARSHRQELLEAGRDLGGSPFSTFLHVTLPLSKTGLLGGAVLIALPMFGDYYTPNIVSGAPTTSMIGNQIDLYFHGGPQPTIGAAITIIMSLFLVILMGYYMWSIHRAQKEVQTL